MQETPEARVHSRGQEDALEEETQPTPVFLPGESPWTEEPGGYSPRVAKRQTPLSTHAVVPSLQVRKPSVPRFILLTAGNSRARFAPVPPKAPALSISWYWALWEVLIVPCRAERT